jgi:two-component system LytT family sensor kinase
MPPHHVVALVHLVGFLLGAALYATLLGVVTRPVRYGRSAPIALRADRLPIITAILGLTWNSSGLAVYAIRDFTEREPPPLLIAVAYLALGYLPAVVVHSVLRSETMAQTRRSAATFIWTAYTVSTLAGVALLWSAARDQVAPSSAALQALTWSYAVLTVPILVLTRKRTGAGRAWSIVALAVFAVSALHLSHHEGVRESLVVELLGHHASIPLIFAILYQDFRFALADVFLKRALTVVALVGIASWLYIGVEIPLLSKHDFRSDAVAIGVSIILWAGVAMVYPTLQRAAVWIVDRLVLRRVDYPTLVESMSATIRSAREPNAVLDQLSAGLRVPLSADEVTWREVGEQLPGGDAIPIPTTETPRFELVVGRLAGGRRLLSGDIEMLQTVAGLAARRIDAMRLEHERGQQRQREHDINRLATEAELRALRAQVNPHFLFNALNTVGYLIQTSPERAQRTLMKLSAILRGVLRTSGSSVPLGDELDLVHAYLDIERARFEERLGVEIEVDDELRGIHVPPFLIQPLVENAIKHGIAPSRDGGRIAVSALVLGDALVISVRNTGFTTNDVAIAIGRREGVGLANLEARLRQHYGPLAKISVTSTPVDTVARLILPLSERDLVGGRRA